MPCIKCANKKWKYGNKGKCKFDSKEKCLEAEKAIHAEKYNRNNQKKRK